ESILAIHKPVLRNVRKGTLLDRFLGLFWWFKNALRRNVDVPTRGMRQPGGARKGQNVGAALVIKLGEEFMEVHGVPAPDIGVAKDGETGRQFLLLLVVLPYFQTIGVIGPKHPTSGRDG